MARKVMSQREKAKRLKALQARIKAEATPFKDVTPKGCKARREAAEADPNLWCKTYLPHYFDTDLAPFHRELGALTEVKGVPVAVAAPRGFGKTTVMKAKVLRCVVTKTRKFIVIIGATNEAAEEITGDIKLELEDNERIRADYGDMSGKGKGDWADGAWKATNGVMVLARGRGQSLRGKSNRASRPDMVIIDDLEDDEQAENPKRVKKCLRYIKRTVIPAMVRGRDWSLFWVGTILARNSALDIVLQDKKGEYKVWVTRFYQAIKPDGTALCPEMHSLEDLAHLKTVIGTRAFNQEKMNNPEDPDGAFREEWLTTYNRAALADELSRGSTVAFLDPSVKSSKQHDYKAIVVGTRHPVTGHVYVRDAWIRQATTNAMIDAAYDICERYDIQQLGVETVGFSELLVDLFDNAALKYGYHLPITKEGQHLNKDLRIQGLSPLHELGKIHYPEDWPGDLGVLKEQLLGWPSRTVHDDGPDALEGMWRLLKEIAQKMAYIPLGSGRGRRMGRDIGERLGGLADRIYQHRGTRGGF